MRPINVTLCSHTWELAKRKKNFSGWVRKQLDDENKAREKPIPVEAVHHAYCKLCDMTHTSRNENQMMSFVCPKCWQMTEYMGCDE
jgi:hypothetical protein